MSDPAKKLPWRERKEKYLAHLGSTKNEDVLLIVAADKLHNARAILSEATTLAGSGTNSAKEDTNKKS